MSKLLIVYYSWANGNTKRIAEQLQKATGADIARIETVKPYTGSYQDVVDQGQREVERGYQPEIQPLGYDVKDYDTIAIGTPTWWYTMAPAVSTFLHQHNWAGKTIIPFMTNGGWPGHVIKDIEAACKGARAVCPLQVQFDSTGGDRLVTSEREIEDWVERVRKLCR